MRVAAILGPGASSKDLKPFQQVSEATWLTGPPATASDADAVMIFGGDGTVHRHLAVLARLQLPVLVVPCGSGNDFARALGLRRVRDSLAAWRRFALERNNVWVIDLGVITPLGPQGLKPDKEEGSDRSAEALRHPKPSQAAELTDMAEGWSEPSGMVPTPAGHYFCTVGGIGLDSEVAQRANRLPRWMRGNGGYAITLLPALLKYSPVRMKITAVGHLLDAPAAQQAKPIFLAAFANAPAYGGGMKIAPQARLDDGKLDICVVHEIDKFKLFCLFPTVYFGHHLNVAEVEYFQTEGVRLETERPLDVYADGEFVCRTPIEVSIARGALRVIVHPTRMAL
jgi:diacylglycerol kinase (ATP)